MGLCNDLTYNAGRVVERITTPPAPMLSRVGESDSRRGLPLMVDEMMERWRMPRPRTLDFLVLVGVLGMSGAMA